MSDGNSLPGVLVETATALASGVRLGQFVSAGLVGLVVDNAVLAALVEVGGLPPVVAKAGSWEAAVLVIFLVNEHWTFAAWGRSGAAALAGRLLRSNVIRLGGFVVTLAVLYALTEWAGLHYLLANVAGIGAGFVVNYLFESLVTWRVHRG